MSAILHGVELRLPCTDSWLVSVGLHARASGAGTLQMACGRFAGASPLQKLARAAASRLCVVCAPGSTCCRAGSVLRARPLVMSASRLPEGMYVAAMAVVRYVTMAATAAHRSVSASG